METDCASCEVQTKLKVLLKVASISQLTASLLYGQRGILNISQPYRPPRPVKGIALRFTFKGERYVFCKVAIAFSCAIY
jgi:hypothetical protein